MNLPVEQQNDTRTRLHQAELLLQAEQERHLVHHCHALGCGKEVPPKLLMCLRHWRMVPRDLQRLVWHNYRPGQEQDKNPTREYLVVMRRAIEAVAEQESRCRRCGFHIHCSDEYCGECLCEEDGL